MTACSTRRPTGARSSRRCARALAAAQGDAERQMNVLREQHQAQVFRLLAQDLAGLLTVEKLADHLSELADRVLGVTLELCWAQLRTRHRDAPRFAVVAYGKLGGKELGYASDLDLIFLYDDADERAPENYARLAQRLNHWLTTRTSSGALFETDLRLRPSGEAGLLVSSVEAFAQYQEKLGLGVGAPGAHARALPAPATRRSAPPSRRSGGASWCGRATPPHWRRRCWRCASACTPRTRTPRACSTSSTTAAA